MNRFNITPEALKEKGYKAYEFSDWTLERACEYIRNGCKCKLKPTYYGSMVGVIIVRNDGYVYEYDVFSRDMTPDELAFYEDWMNKERKKEDKVSSRIHAKNMKKIRYRA